ncbi:odorant receptor 10a [Bactrocera neohumeralis]|uniref:odorant receptor 10a n=1 Tax=Bactrocera neohumeralis TaxID=98809 RepID=UPI002166974E|nr:odorant receptor 10a [Bactrocera neohumeralis]
MNFRFLSRTFPLRDYYFYVPKLCLGALGFWPLDTSAPNASNVWAWVNLIILTIGVFTEIHAGCTVLKTDLELALDTLCPAGTSAVTLLKMALIYYYRKDLAWVLKRMRDLVYERNVSINTVKKHIVRAHAVTAARLNFIPFVMGFITCTSYNLKPLLMTLILYIQGQEPMWKLPFNMTMPSFLLHAPYFPLTYIFTAYTGYITIFMYGGCDAFYFEFCSNTAALLELLQNDLKSIIHFDQLSLTTEESTVLEWRLVQFIKRHNDIIELTRFFCKRYTVITLAHFVSAGLVIGASIFDLMTFTGFGIVIYIGYTIAVLGQLFIYCYGGSMVAESSVQLATVAFGCDWHACNPRLRRYVLMIIMRSQRAINMSVPFFAPSLITFTSILQTSGSIIALASSFK